MNLKLDLFKSGLEMFFKEYQYETLRVMWESKTGLISSEVTELVNSNIFDPVSRASIINFLNDMLELGVLGGTGETGKGGYRTRYYPKKSEEELVRYLSETVEKKLVELVEN